ncbi:MAG: HipA domain-containing protein [Pseudomonadota bacterium]
MDDIPHTHNLCTIEAWLNAAWVAIATLERLDDGEFGCRSPARLTYLLEHALVYADTRGPAALSVNQPVALMPNQNSTWPAVLADLLPQGDGRRRLAQHLDLPAERPASDWPLLLAGAGNPIGHLRIREAADTLRHGRSQFDEGWTREEVCSRDASFLEQVHAAGFALGGSSGVQGEWPKLLLTQDAEQRWHLDHQLPDAKAARHWLVKFSRRDDSVYDDILRAEAAYHALAGELGLRTQGESVYHQGLLFVQRFDRLLDASGSMERIAQESLYSLTGRTGFDQYLNHDQVCQALAECVTEPARELTEYVWRDAINLALGNRDNHGRNTAIQRFANGRIALAPIFDLAPMCLHPDAMARRMRWRQEEGGRPDWRAVAEQVAETNVITAADLRGRYASWAAALQGVPERLQTLGCPARVLTAIARPLAEVIADLRKAS